MATRNYEGKKFEMEASHKIMDSLTIEEALQININDTPFTVSMRTPGEDGSLVRGLLHSEGVINDVNFVPDVILKKENGEGIVTIVNVSIPKKKLGEGYSNSRSLLSVSSCGICGKTELSDLAFIGKTIDDTQKIDIGLIHQLFEKMNTSQHNFKQSGGTHAAVAFSINGKLLSSMEDIGRHNAVDKVVGKLITLGTLDEAKIMTVSGRISYEIVSKRKFHFWQRFQRLLRWQSILPRNWELPFSRFAGKVELPVIQIRNVLKSTNRIPKLVRNICQIILVNY